MSAPVSPVPSADDPGAVVPVLRGLLYVAAALVFLAGVPLYVFPEHTDRYFAWTIDSRMTAVFLGGAYWSAIGLELGAARAAGWSRARIAVPAVFVFTSLTLVVSLVHVAQMHLRHHAPASAQVVAWVWLAIYALVPLVMAIGWIAQHRRLAPTPPRRGLPSSVRVVLVVLAALLLGSGVTMLVAPGLSTHGWPWTLTPFTRGVIGAWLIGLGVAAGHARLVDDAPSLRPLGLTGIAFGVLQAGALLRHGNELDRGVPSAAAYVACLVTLTALSSWVLLNAPADEDGDPAPTSIDKSAAAPDPPTPASVPAGRTASRVP